MDDTRTTTPQMVRCSAGLAKKMLPTTASMTTMQPISRKLPMKLKFRCVLAQTPAIEKNTIAVPAAAIAIFRSTGLIGFRASKAIAKLQESGSGLATALKCGAFPRRRGLPAHLEGRIACRASPAASSDGGSPRSSGGGVAEDRAGCRYRRSGFWGAGRSTRMPSSSASAGLVAAMPE